MEVCGDEVNEENRPRVALERMVVPQEGGVEVVRERDKLTFRVVKEESIDAVVGAPLDLSAVVDAAPRNPLDVQARYVVQEDVSAKYISYDSPYEPAEAREKAPVYHHVAREAKLQREVMSEIVHKKHDHTGSVRQPEYADYGEQAQMEWYKVVNRWMIMFLYDVL